MFRSTWILVPIALLLAVSAIAQESPATDAESAPTEAEAPPPLSTSDIASRADQVAPALLEIQKLVDTVDPAVAAIPGDIDLIRQDMDNMLPSLGAGAIEDMSESEVETLQQKLSRITSQLDSRRNRLQQDADELDNFSRSIKTELDFFQSILADDAAGDNPEALITRLEEIIGKLEAVRSSVVQRLDETLVQLSRIAATQLQIAEANQAIAANKQQRERNALTFDRSPIWDITPFKESLPRLVLKDFQSRIGSVTEYAKANGAKLILTALLLIAILAGSILLRPAILRLGEERQVDAARKPFVERPISLALLLWVLLVPEILLPQLPLALGIVRLLIVVATLWRLLPLIAPMRERRGLAGLLGLTVLSGVLEVLQQSDLSDRLVLLFVSAAGMLFFRRFAQSLRTAPDRQNGLWWWLGLILSVAAPFILGICIVAVVIGAVAFAQQTVDGILFMFTLILAIFVVEAALNEVSQFLITGSGQTWIRSVRRYPELARRRFALLIRIAMLIIFIAAVPRLFPLVGLIYDGLINALTHDFSVGTVAMSVGDVLGVIAGAVLAVYVARFIRFTLDEDIFPRLPIASGAASAASRMVYYALVAGGILFVLAAGGVQLTKLTLVISALGVGIGFGLQGIVNNFVSGLVLAFERPFQVGDIIAVGTLTGRVREIGLRASRVRTFDGAEVIVPNADLIAGNVINWTLSDRMRRLDIRVGVAYGTDPARVREILLKVADDSEIVAKNPEPGALFEGFGDSSLNFTLRAWISEAGDWPQISSDLYEAVHTAITEADIEIPFPQRTLHIQSDDRAE